MGSDRSRRSRKHRRHRTALTRSKRSLLTVGALALVYGVAALGSGIDREGEDHPRWSSVMPRAFAVRSLQPRGAALMAARQGPALVNLARDYVSRAPYDGVASSMLGTGLILTNRPVDADKAFRVGAQFGWRLPIVQYYWLDQSLQLGDGALAAMRLDALLRKSPGLASSATLMEPFEANPALHPYLLAHMEANPDWLGAFAADTSPNVSDDRLGLRADILDQLAMRNHPIGCIAARPITARLVQQGRALAAMHFWRTQCRDPQAGVVNDGLFREASLDNAKTSAFRWEVLGSGDVYVDIKPGDGGNMLTGRNNSGFAMPFVRQLILAPAGDYDLTWHATGGNPGAGPPVTPTLSCYASDTVPALPVKAEGQGVWTSRIHLGGECEGQWLNFQFQGNSTDITFGNVTMRAAPAS